MSDQSGYSGGHLLAAFLGGAAAGVAAALLTAPRSGKESREHVKVYLNERQDEAARLPDAVKAAKVAAQDAFTAAINTES